MTYLSRGCTANCGNYGSCAHSPWPYCRWTRRGSDGGAALRHPVSTRLFTVMGMGYACDNMLQHQSSPNRRPAPDSDSDELDEAVLVNDVRSSVGSSPSSSSQQRTCGQTYKPFPIITQWLAPGCIRRQPLLHPWHPTRRRAQRRRRRVS